MGNSGETGGFEGLLGAVGLIGGAVVAMSQNGEGCGVAIVVGLIFGAIGAFIGKLVDQAVAFIITLLAVVVVIVVNAAVRQFVLGFLKAIFSS